MRKFTYLVYRQKSRRCPICSLGTLLNPVATHWHVLHHRNLTLTANHLHQTTSITPNILSHLIHTSLRRSCRGEYGNKRRQYDTNFVDKLLMFLGRTDTMKLKTITSITKPVLQTFYGEACESYWRRKNWSQII